jgi:hypothetical protein
MPIVAEVGERLTVIEASAVIVMVALALFVESETDVAVSAIVLCGTVAGAVYVMAAPEALVIVESEPQLFAVAHESDHVTPLLPPSFETFAINVCVAFGAREEVVGEIETVMGVGGGAEDCGANDPRGLKERS